MTETNTERTARLLSEACGLPETPGVYIMRDRNDKIIYVGKSKRLRDRVSQYFRSGEKSLKTQMMVSNVYRFETIHCQSEIEALSLENTLIKRYDPKYNIKLKDAKSYPYIKMSGGEWPRLSMTRKREGERARYFGPYSGTATVYSVMDLVNKIFGFPTCKRVFPRDIGKGRPCINYQMGRCMGVCTGRVDPVHYKEMTEAAGEVLRGNTAGVRRELNTKMLEYAEKEQFEAAAKCRDTVFALEKLSERQKVVADIGIFMDAVGVYIGDLGSVLSLLKIREGRLIDKLDFPLGVDAIADGGAFFGILTEHYRQSGEIPKRIAIDFECDAEDMTAFAEYISGIAGRASELIRPMRGDNKKLCDMAAENARQAAEKLSREETKSDGALIRLGELLGLEAIPDRIESYDISNYGNENITAGMIVYERDGFKKSDYRLFKIRSTETADDYASMREALTRRFEHLSDTSGAYAVVPDLILLDGGEAHLNVALGVLEKMGLDIPVVGMVKDDYHKTRALVTREGEVNIAREREVYVLVYRIQEEVHRFTVSRMTAAKRKTVKHSSLEKIPGIGPGKAKLLLDKFGGLSAVREADVAALSGVKGITHRDAEAIAAYFKETK